MTDNVLIVEDDLDIAELIRVNLHEIGIASSHLTDGVDLFSVLDSQRFSLIILDVMLPTCNGLDLCRSIRQALPEQAILMLTSKTSETDRILGLELGADDYMTKPFSVRELQARVRSQLRKANIIAKRLSEHTHVANDIITVSALHIDIAQHTARIAGQAIELTATEFDLLCHFAKHPNQVFSRLQLLESVWGYQHTGYEHTVNSHINRLRNKLSRLSNGKQIIATVWGVGYKLAIDSLDEL